MHKMKKDKWIIRLLKNNFFACALAAIIPVTLNFYVSFSSSIILGLSVGALVGVLLFRIIRLEGSVKDLRAELEEVKKFSNEHKQGSKICITGMIIYEKAGF